MIKSNLYDRLPEEVKFSPSVASGMKNAIFSTSKASSTWNWFPFAPRLVSGKLRAAAPSKSVCCVAAVTD
jgi:hypothetical protein